MALFATFGQTFDLLTSERACRAHHHQNSALISFTFSVEFFHWRHFGARRLVCMRICVVLWRADYQRRIRPARTVLVLMARPN